MAMRFSFVGRSLGAATAFALLAASLTAPATAMPSIGLVASADGSDSILKVQAPGDWQRQKQWNGAHPVHPGLGPHPGQGHWNKHGYWRNGQWIAPSIAFGVLGAAAAAAAFGAPPAPGMCWYYDDPYQQTGHWDYC